jgi:hypothetical protein
MTWLWAGCTTTAQVQAVRHTATGIKPKEAIAFVSWRPSLANALDSQPIDEEEIVTCISEEVRKAQPGLRIVARDEFRRAAFPNLPPEATPTGPEYLSLLLNHATFRERIVSLGIRYLIHMRGETVQTGKLEAGGIGGAGAGVLVIGGSWDRNTRFSASILLDLEQSRRGESTREHVWAALGQPYATGRWMMPIDDRARTVWTYYYEDGRLTDARRVLLFVYFDQDRYDGYMWFSSTPK